MKAEMKSMKKKDIEQMLICQAAAILSVEPAAIRPDVSLPRLGLDSLGFVELLVFIEKKFDLNLIESNLAQEDFQTIHSLAGRISKKASYP